MRASAECAIQTYKVERGEKPTVISERQATKKYTWSAVRRWKREGKVPMHKNGDKNHKLNFDAQQLQQIDSAEKVAVFLHYQASINS
jgi:hypothetical protein